MARQTLKTTGVHQSLLRSKIIKTPKTAEEVSKIQKPKTSTKLRTSIVPGTVLILLAGRFRGKRVVFLKQLASGLLLVTGPYKVNGVPLQRVNQAYVIGTSTKVDVSAVKLSAKLTDELFVKAKKEKSSKVIAEDTKSEKVQVSSDRLSLQKEVDTQLIAAIKKIPLLKSYISSVFTLRKGQAPHTLKF